jgi:GNAT superfamily N-acetyltransferase
MRTHVPARDRGLAAAATVGPVPAEIEIAPVTAAEYESLLPLIAAYQRFYEVEEIDDERNRDFFRRFLAPYDVGMLLAARGGGAKLVGYACLYWHFSSTQAVETVLMNDLFVDEAVRARGVGRALIEASAAVARERGAAHLEWSTAPDNLTAQRLYDRTGAERSEWIEYELGL